jgi:hypothetical protein
VSKFRGLSAQRWWMTLVFCPSLSPPVSFRCTPPTTVVVASIAALRRPLEAISPHPLIPAKPVKAIQMPPIMWILSFGSGSTQSTPIGLARSAWPSFKLHWLMVMSFPHLLFKSGLTDVDIAGNWSSECPNPEVEVELALSRQERHVPISPPHFIKMAYSHTYTITRIRPRYRENVDEHVRKLALVR